MIYTKGRYKSINKLTNITNYPGVPGAYKLQPDMKRA